MSNRLFFRSSVFAVMLAFTGAASAVGLGDLQGQAVLGEKLRLTAEIQGQEARYLDNSCFRLVSPVNGNDLPWLRKATLTVLSGAVPRLEIRTEQALSEPLMAMAIQIGCGHGVVRQYVLAGLPAFRETAPHRETPAFPAAAVGDATPAPKTKPHVVPAKRPAAAPAPVAPLAPAANVAKPAASSAATARSLSSRSATELLAAIDGARLDEAQRERLRTELKLLQSLGEQGAGQAATEAKLRQLEENMQALQLQASTLARQAEKTVLATPASPAAPAAQPQTVSAQATPAQPAPAVGAAPSAAPQDAATPAPVPAATPAQPAPPVVQVAPVVVADEPTGLSLWSVLGVLLGAVLGAGGWLLWKNRGSRRGAASAVAPSAPVAVRAETVDVVVPARQELDVAAESVQQPAPAPVDALSREAAAAQELANFASSVAPSLAPPDAQLEVNPVMELADIMLSFGRVKGAAQALQEYIDKNPQQALQPWIRLMDVYRMADMRDEFEEVARNLNAHFNVEVQRWEDIPVSSGIQVVEYGSQREESALELPRPQSLEELPRILDNIQAQWQESGVLDYLHQLLRDNRGGQRQGFSLPVVEELVFLIEVREMRERIEQGG